MAISFRQLARRRNITPEQVELLYSLRGLHTEAIELLPDPALRRSVRRLDVPDAPRERMASRLDQYRDDRGQIPALPLVRALRQLDSFRIRSRGGLVAGIPTGGPVHPGLLGIIPAAGLAPRKWRALGPGNIGGRTRSILVHRVNHDTRWAVSADGAVLLAATKQGLRRSADPARTSWQPVLPDAVGDVTFHPTDPSRAVAGSLSTGAAWYTTDGGASWKQSTHAGAWGRRVELCYAKASSDVVYASVDAQHGEIWRSINGGRSFTKRRSRFQNQPANYLGDQGWYGNSIWAGDPTNADLVIVGGVDLWRSTDGGDTLQDISTWWDSRSAHADHHAIVSHPAYDGHNNRTVFFGNDGGIYRADDVTTVGNDAQPPRISGWTNLNNSYGVTQFYSAAGNRNSGVIVGGAQDNGTLAYDPAAGPDHWRTIFGGDGGFCAADPTDPNIFYGEYVYLNIHRNTDGATTDDIDGDRYISGQFWNAALRRWDWKPAPFQIPDAFNQRALFIAPFGLDPNEPNRILAGGESLWRTNDARAANTPTDRKSTRL